VKGTKIADSLRTKIAKFKIRRSKLQIYYNRRIKIAIKPSLKGVTDSLPTLAS
jgi:hypothetical protein